MNKKQLTPTSDINLEDYKNSLKELTLEWYELFSSWKVERILLNILNRYLERNNRTASHKVLSNPETKEYELYVLYDDKNVALMESIKDRLVEALLK